MDQMAINTSTFKTNFVIIKIGGNGENRSVLSGDCHRSWPPSPCALMDARAMALWLANGRSNEAVLQQPLNHSLKVPALNLKTVRGPTVVAMIDGA